MKKTADKKGEKNKQRKGGEIAQRGPKLRFIFIQTAA